MEASSSSVLVESVISSESIVSTITSHSQTSVTSESGGTTSSSKHSLQQPERQFQARDYPANRWVRTFASLSNLRERCRVCRKQASGIHYGVISCQRCKEAYRRAVRKSSDLICVKSTDPGNCNVKLQSGRKCLACLVDRCREAGMSINAVKLRWNCRPNMLPFGTPSCVRRLTSVFRRHFIAYIKKINEQELTPHLLTDRALEVGSPSFKHVMFSEFSQSYESLALSLLRFSKLIPGFSKLHNDDQMILFKTGFMDCWYILNAHRLFKYEHCILLHDNTLIPRTEFTTIYSKPYVSEMEKVCKDIKEMKLLSAEKALLISIVLTVPERANLLKANRAGRLQKTYFKLAQQVYQLKNPKSKENRLEKLKTLVNAIKQLGKQHSLLMNYYRQSPDKLTVSDVIKEIFDLHPQQKYKENEDKKKDD